MYAYYKDKLSKIKIIFKLKKYILKFIRRLKYLITLIEIDLRFQDCKKKNVAHWNSMFFQKQKIMQN